MKSTNAYALLGLLTRESMTGYEMKCWVENALTHFWKTSYGQIYPTLKKFVQDELVVVEDVENDKGPDSKKYTITEKGLNELTEWLLIDVADFNDKDETLLKLFFSDLLSIDTVIEKLERSMAHNQEILDKYFKSVSQMKGSVELPTRSQMNEYLCTRKGVYLNEARIKWAKECIEALKWLKEQNNSEERD